MIALQCELTHSTAQISIRSRKKGEVNTIEYLAYGNYNHYENRRCGLSGTKETRTLSGWLSKNKTPCITIGSRVTKIYHTVVYMQLPYLIGLLRPGSFFLMHLRFAPIYVELIRFSISKLNIKIPSCCSR